MECLLIRRHPDEREEPWRLSTRGLGLPLGHEVRADGDATVWIVVEEPRVVSGQGLPVVVLEQVAARFRFGDGTTAQLTHRSARILTRNLRRLAAGELGDVADPAAADTLADAIEARLGERDDELVIAAESEHEALRRMLELPSTPTADPNVAAMRRAVRRALAPG
jgi:hypothetical protein